MLKRGSKNAVFMRGDYKPAKLYKGTQLVAGWSPVTKTAPCAWDGTYNDFLDVTLKGAGKQDVPAPVNLFSMQAVIQAGNCTDITIASDRLSASALGNTGSVDPGNLWYANGWLTFYAAGAIPAGSYTLALDLEILEDGATSERYIYARRDDFEIMQAFALPKTRSGHLTFAMEIAQPLTSLTVTLNSSKLKVSNIMVVQPGTNTDTYIPYSVSGPKWDAPVALQAGSGTLKSRSRDGAKQSEVVLPVLRAIPGTGIRDTAEYLGGGSWRVTHNVCALELSGSESWTKGGDKTDADGVQYSVFWMYARQKLDVPEANNTRAIRVCSHLPCYRTYWAPGFPEGSAFSADGSGLYHNAGGYPQMFGLTFKKADISTLEQFKAWLAAQQAAGTPVTIWYQRETPVTETLALGELKTYPGYTALEVTGALLPDVTAGAKAADVTDAGVVQSGTELYIRSGVLVSQNEDRLTIGG